MLAAACPVPTATGEAEGDGNDQDPDHELGVSNQARSVAWSMMFVYQDPHVSLRRLGPSGSRSPPPDVPPCAARARGEPPKETDARARWR
jgi:hypothetical protein